MYPRSAVQKVGGKVSKTAKRVYREGDESDVYLVEIGHCSMSTALKFCACAILMNFLSLCSI
jgi:hypothetical protein